MYPTQEVTNKKRGFTLLELLIGVLIIGILAAVAVPQYQKAVLKSRFSTLFALSKALADSQENYYLANGQYSSRLEELDISTLNNASGSTVTLPDGLYIKLGTEEKHMYVRAEKNNLNNALVIYQQHSPNFPGEIHCEALQDDSLANWLCQDGLQGTLVGSKYGYNIYALNTQSPQGELTRWMYDMQNAVLTDGDVCEDTRQRQNGCYKVNATNSTCTTETDWGCEQGTFDNSTCEGKANRSCANGTFKNNSQCLGSEGPYSCSYGSTFDNSTCFGNSNSCSATYTNHSTCVGNSAWGCQRSTFTNHSVCYANAYRDSHQTGACYGSTYDATSCCTGSYCEHEEDTCAYKGITPPPQPVYQSPLN